LGYPWGFFYERINNMADSKVSALTAVATPAGTDEFPVNQGGVSKKMTLSQISVYAEPLSAASTAAQSPAAATDTYITGSAITLPTTRLIAGSMYRLRIHASKTAAGTAAQTATANAGTIIELLVNFRAVGSGTTGIIQAGVAFAGGAGFPTAGATGTSAGFDTTPANSKIGVSVNTGTSAAWTFTIVQADLLNFI